MNDPLTHTAALCPLVSEHMRMYRASRGYVELYPGSITTHLSCLGSSKDGNGHFLEGLGFSRCMARMISASLCSSLAHPRAWRLAPPTPSWSPAIRKALHDTRSMPYLPAAPRGAYDEDKANKAEGNLACDTALGEREGVPRARERKTSVEGVPG